MPAEFLCNLSTEKSDDASYHKLCAVLPWKNCCAVFAGAAVFFCLFAKKTVDKQHEICYTNNDVDIKWARNGITVRTAVTERAGLVKLLRYVDRCYPRAFPENRNVFPALEEKREMQISELGW
ncbi:hypothetical protein RUMCAL_02883 [Ruminococcus callidus ATCC 27760]|uniref:Uncharacterized protein n=1 Tax=Ruminococcus callidus ATCC 27760 TaxID=411473 RepID=U2LS55_9FIRM|nr:hypothetical protein RUMCAL_02883 [Ruminococcus callidus ATCC 27760]